MSVFRPFLLFLFVLPSVFLHGQYAFFEKVIKAPNVDSAIYFADGCIDFARNRKDTAQLIDATCLLARKLSVKALYIRAEKLLYECLSFSFVKTRPVYAGKLHLELASVYKYEGDYSSSLANYLKAKNIFEKLSSWNYLVKCETQLAEYYRKLGKYNNANGHIKEALAHYEKNKLADTSLLIGIYNRAAAIDNESNPDVSATLRNSRMALRLAVKSKDRDAEATSLNELGFTFKNLLRLDSSEILYKKAEDIWFSLGADREALNAMNNRAMLYAHNNLYPKKKLLQLYAEMIEIVKSRKIDYPLTDAYSFLYNASISAGDSSRAHKFFYQYHESIISEITKRNDLQIVNMTEQYESEKARKEVKRVSGELSDSLLELERKNAENKRIYFFISVLIGLTAVIAFLLLRLNKTNKKLAERNREKDALIQEIHHRVKNNLQFISSLINMQMNSSIDDKEIHTLNDASRRIRAMALVHEMLYNHKESSGISIKQYLEELVISLDQLVNSEKIPIAFKMNVDDKNFNVSDSIALGMITSELVSNSMKHAFKNVNNPEIEVVLQKNKNSYSFSVRDNGIGSIPVTDRKKTLGLRLIDIFSRQLKGKYSIAMNNGYSYELQFSPK